ncbi:hypothetical protein [Gracilimonas sp.]|uniref:hypothetical protein n=1 Tax=Gracilimonas sp. TaxID=1974203 RepID=UPI0032EF4F5D
MGINGTFQSFVHSEVKTNRGFRLVEAYLTYKNLAGRTSDDFSEYEVIEEKKEKPHTNATSFTAEPDFTFNTSFEEMPDTWINMKPHDVSQHLVASGLDPLNRKRIHAYQALSRFTPKGQTLDYKF